MMPRATQLPVEPFVNWLNERAATVGGLRTIEQMLGVPESALSRIRKQKTVSFEVVDRTCIALGWHPIEVYGDEW